MNKVLEKGFEFSSGDPMCISIRSVTFSIFIDGKPRDKIFSFTDLIGGILSHPFFLS